MEGAGEAELNIHKPKIKYQAAKLLSFFNLQMLKMIYFSLLFISFHGNLKSISQATQHMYNAAYLKIMYIQNYSQGLIHVLGV